MTSPLVLLTGINGFVAGQVAETLLSNGYRVRGTARPTAAKPFQNIHISNLEVIVVDDVASGDFSNALKDVYAVIHVASPIPGKMSAEAVLKATYDGALNVFRQAQKAGVKKIIFTSTFGALFDASGAPAFSGQTFNEYDWSPTTTEQITAKSEDSNFAYFGLKAIAERAIWDFAREHPELDVATILPGMIYGPWARSLPPPPRNTNLGTNSFIEALISGSPPPTVAPFIVDARDVALAHVRALALPPKPTGTSSIEEKRFIVNAGNLTWQEVSEHIKTVRPDLSAAGVVVEVERIPGVPGPLARLDATRAREVLGIDFIDPRKTVEDAVAAIIEVKKGWGL